MKFKTLKNPCLPEVELILTAEEAQVLATIVGKISGNYESGSPRAFISELYNTLSRNGYVTNPLGSAVKWKGELFTFTGGTKVNK